LPNSFAMLTLNATTAHRGFCDGRSRRDFLKIGGLAMGGMSLPDLLRAETAQGQRPGHKAVIMVFLPGGPSHQDIFDIKPDAPSEIRGEFKPIGTSVDGLQICELLPRLARQMDRCTVIRSMADCDTSHDAFQCLTGRNSRQQPPGGWPAFGSVVSRLQGPVDPATPPFIGLSPKMGHMPWARNGEPGFLGVAHAPFEANRGGGTADMKLNGMSLDRLHDRATLLKSFDQLRRDLDAGGLMAGMDAFNEQALGVLTSPKLLEALDLTREDRRIAERYGKGENRNRDDGGPRLTEHFLAARRLVEAGARVVTLGFSRWDYHSNNFGQLREDLPLLDSALSAAHRPAGTRPGKGGRRRRLGRIRPHAGHQSPGRARPLAARLLRPARRRRLPPRPGHRRDRQGRRRGHRPPGRLRRGLRHTLPPPRHRHHQGHPRRLQRSPAVPRRWHTGAAGRTALRPRSRQEPIAANRRFGLS
jgi:hypothetical protein